jgi:hypothetical protein
MRLVEKLGTKTGEHLMNVAWHRDGNGVASGVECNVHPEVLIAVGTDSDFVVVQFECFLQVGDQCRIVIPITHAEIVDDQVEHDVAGMMPKQAWGVGALVITKLPSARNLARPIILLTKDWPYIITPCTNKLRANFQAGNNYCLLA